MSHIIQDLYKDWYEENNKIILVILYKMRTDIYVMFVGIYSPQDLTFPAKYVILYLQG